MSDLTGSEIEPQTSGNNSDVVNHCAYRLLTFLLFKILSKEWLIVLTLIKFMV